MNTTESFHGWLLDLYPRGSDMVLWVIGDDGRRRRLLDPYTPELYVTGPDMAIEACMKALERSGELQPAGWTERLDFWTGKPRPVFAARVLHVEHWRRSLDRHAEHFPALAWYQADLMPEQTYCYARDVFPLARCRFETEGDRILAITCEDDRWATCFDVPPLRTAELSARGELLGPRPRLESLSLECEGRALAWDSGEDILTSFEEELARIDPDVLLSSGGDAFILPLLLTLAARQKRVLRLDRDVPAAREARKDGRSFFSYGRILYQAPEYPLYGRWHLDRKNSFTMSHNGLEGLYEVVRLSRIPAQRIGRRSIGTGITSIQLDIAFREGFLIPWKKTHPESWKTASQLLKTDRGGLVYAPETGFHEQVVELDFVSMYPSIMSRFNVSPETVNCSCCHNARVPELGYTICEQRQGLVSRSLAPIIAKRVEYKKLRKAAKATADAGAYARYDQRQDALKWMLVCCFGYLGYRNARFGRIEAHEAVSAYSRELLTVARETCEAAGWRMLHANVDCVWIVKPGFQREEVEELCRRIDAATGLTIALEGIYKWIAFLPSRQFPDRPVPTRYFGAFEDGSIKYRGIECRRGDLPPMVKDEQLRLLKDLATAANLAEYRARAADLLREIDSLERRLWNHDVPLDTLVIRQSLSQAPEEYGGNGMQALAARQASKAGLNLHAGQSLAYIIVRADDPDRDRRVRLTTLLEPDTAADPVAYVRLLRRAMNTLLWPAGIVLDEEKIASPFAPTPKKKKPEPETEQLRLFDASA